MQIYFNILTCACFYLFTLILHAFTLCIMQMCVQVKAREAGLWNLFLPAVSGLSQLDYAYIAEETGRCFFAPEVFNCQAPGKICYMVSDYFSWLHRYRYSKTIYNKLCLINDNFFRC